MRGYKPVESNTAWVHGQVEIVKGEDRMKEKVFAYICKESVWALTNFRGFWAVTHIPTGAHLPFAKDVGIDTYDSDRNLMMRTMDKLFSEKEDLMMAGEDGNVRDSKFLALGRYMQRRFVEIYKELLELKRKKDRKGEWIEVSEEIQEFFRRKRLIEGL